MTWMVHLRDPAALRRHAGPVPFAALQLFVGGASIVYLLSPLLWLHTLLWWCLPAGSWAEPPAPVAWLCLFTLVCGFALQWCSAIGIVRQERWRGMGWSVALFPFYWLLHSLAAVRALWQFFREPYRWDKTEHRPDARRISRG